MKRYDERDNMFSRMNLKPETKEYEDYYKRNYDKKEIDDNIRQMPNICGPGTATYHPLHSVIADANFMFLNDIKHLSQGQVNPNKAQINPEEMTTKLKGLASYYGAKLVGITKMKDYHYYSHRGRHSEVYGQEVKCDHSYGIVFAVEMDKEMINRAPQVSEVIETSRAYVEAAIIGMMISYYIRQLGYQARNHMDANYLVIAPLIAKEAGLGEIGRNGVLTTKEYGSRVRLGVVTTDMELIEDKEQEFGLSELCRICEKCAHTCPGRAIPRGEMAEINGQQRWQIKQEDCYTRWRALGTDCGICIASCPLSQGVDMDLVNKIISNPKVMGEILEQHEKKFPVRPYLKDAPDWMK